MIYFLLSLSIIINLICMMAINKHMIDARKCFRKYNEDCKHVMKLISMVNELKQYR